MADSPSRQELGINRRSFMKIGALGALAVAATSAGCTPHGVVETGEGDGGEYLAGYLEGGEWVAVSCSKSCGNQCLNQGYLKDGVIIRQKTDDTHPDSFDFAQMRSCIKGRKMRDEIYAPDRLNYPLKRKGWQPGGGENSQGQLRGVDEWERISWDEAYDYIAGEFERIKTSYGNRAFFNPGLLDWRATGAVYSGWLLNAYGGCVTTWGQQSNGATPLCSFMTTGSTASQGNDRQSLLDAKLIVLWGCNVAYTKANYSYFLQEARKAGARIITIDPWLSPTAQGITDQWIAVRPGTDGALLLGMAYHMIENDLHNQEFLDTYCLGFDAEHMPADAKVDENFKDYVLGRYDDTPKTPEWAAQICGVGPEVIRAFAEEATSTYPLTWKAGIAPARTYNGSSFVRLFLTVGWMIGSMGESGAEVGSGYSWGFSEAPVLSGGKTGIEFPPINLDVCTGVWGGGGLMTGVYDPNQFHGFAYTDSYDAILNKEANDFVHGKTPVDIRCIVNLNKGQPLNNSMGVMKGIEAYRSVEFVVSADFFMNTNCLYSDIVLPSISSWERTWGDTVFWTVNSTSIISSRQIMEPQFERRDDSVIEMDIAERLGMPRQSILNISLEQAAFNKVAGTGITEEDGSVTPLCTVTSEDIERFGVEGEPQEGIMGIDELLSVGSYQVEQSKTRIIGYQAFLADPEANPLGTTSGKFEIHCQSLVEAVERFNTTSEPALPKYAPADEGYERVVAGSEYPFQFVSMHHIAHIHGDWANIVSGNELFPNSLLMNEQDVRAQGLQSGDTALVSSMHGRILRIISATPAVAPGVVILGHGNWVDLDEDGIDHGGNSNVLSGARLVGEGFCPWNSTLVKVEKWSGAPLEKEFEKPRRIIEGEEG
jgi:anaerobic dimethyl sulfoxide reductase subunit A